MGHQRMTSFANMCDLGLGNEKCATPGGTRISEDYQSSEPKSNNALFVIVTVARILYFVPPISLRSMTFLRRNLDKDSRAIAWDLFIILPIQVTAQTSNAIAHWCEPPVTLALTPLELTQESARISKASLTNIPWMYRATQPVLMPNVSASLLRCRTRQTGTSGF